MILLRAVGLGAGHPDSFPHVILQVSRNVVAAAVVLLLLLLLLLLLMLLSCL